MSTYDDLNRYQIIFHEADVVLFRETRAIPPSEMEDVYLSVARNDFSKVAKHLFATCRPVDSRYDNSRVQLTTDDCLEFKASVSPLHDSPQPGAAIKISLGVALGLDDLFFRMCSNENFFNQEPEGGEARYWPGGDCFWPMLAGLDITRRNPLETICERVLTPTLRFKDYSGEQPTPKQLLFLHTNSTSFASRYYSAIPSNNKRRLIAMNMTGVALRWILLHEESHFSEGHCALHNSQNKSYTQRSARNADSAVQERMVLEWHADRSATEGAYDLFAEELRTHALQHLPDNCSPDQAIRYNLRLLLAAIGSVALLFRYHEQLNGVASHYPHARSRLVAIYYAVLKRLSFHSEMGNHPVTKEDFVWAMHGSLIDLDSVCCLFGRQLRGYESGVPSYVLDEFIPDKEVDLFDGTPQTLRYVCAKFFATLGDNLPVNIDSKPSLGDEIENRLDEQWFAQLKQIVAAFDNGYRQQLEQLRPFGCTN